MMRAFLTTNRCGKRDNKLISKVMLIFILVVVKNVCHKISLCEDSWSLLQLDFANKKIKKQQEITSLFEQPSHQCPCLSVFTSRVAHATGFSVKKVSGIHTHQLASPKPGPWLSRKVSSRANWLAWLAFAHRGLLGIFKEPEWHFPWQKKKKK